MKLHKNPKTEEKNKNIYQHFRQTKYKYLLQGSNLACITDHKDTSAQPD